MSVDMIYVKENVMKTSAKKKALVIQEFKIVVGGGIVTGNLKTPS